MRITFGRGNNRNTVELPHASIRKHDEQGMRLLVANIEERVLHPSLLLERKGFHVYNR